MFNVHLYRYCINIQEYMLEIRAIVIIKQKFPHNNNEKIMYFLDSRIPGCTLYNLTFIHTLT